MITSTWSSGPEGSGKMDNITILEIAAECERAHTEFIGEIDRIALKYGLPCKIAREIAYEVFKEVDLDGTDNS